MTTPAETRAPRSLAHALEHDVPPPVGNYRWVYLWHWPIRAMHWAAAASLFLLIVTGFVIGKPYFLPQAEAICFADDETALLTDEITDTLFELKLSELRQVP